MHNRHTVYLATHYAVCTYVYIVICNNVRLIVGKVTLRDVIAKALCGSLSVHTNRY